MKTYVANWRYFRLFDLHSIHFISKLAVFPAKRRGSVIHLVVIPRECGNPFFAGVSTVGALRMRKVKMEFPAFAPLAVPE